MFQIIYGCTKPFILVIAGMGMTYVNIRGKAGVTTSLIETSLVYQTILDAIFFERYPNWIQIIGLILALSSSFIIIYGYSNIKK